MSKFEQVLTSSNKFEIVSNHIKYCIMLCNRIIINKTNTSTISLVHFQNLKNCTCSVPRLSIFNTYRSFRSIISIKSLMSCMQPLKMIEMPRQLANPTIDTAAKLGAKNVGAVVGRLQHIHGMVKVNHLALFWDSWHKWQFT